MTRTVYVDSGRLRYAQNISVGPHSVQADELTDSGGNDVGPEPIPLTGGDCWLLARGDAHTLRDSPNTPPNRMPMSAAAK